MTDAELESIYNEAIEGEGKTVIDGLRAVAEYLKSCCIQACENEYLVEPTEQKDDISYDRAISDCIKEIISI